MREFFYYENEQRVQREAVVEEVRITMSKQPMLTANPDEYVTRYEREAARNPGVKVPTLQRKGFTLFVMLPK